MGKGGKISAAALSRELGRLMPGHRISSGGGIPRCVIVTPESKGELLDVVRLAFEKQVPVLPMAMGHRSVLPEELHIRVDMKTLNRIIEFNESSRLVTVQAGVGLAGLGSWLAGKKMILPVHFQPENEIQLWEFLQQPWAGGYGPAGGHKLEQVMALTAVLPDGTEFSSSLSPRRAAGPDFSWLLLGGMGRFGLVTEATLRVVPSPVRVARAQYWGEDLPAIVEAVWNLVPRVNPNDVTIVGRRGGDPSSPRYMVLWTIWGERRDISRKKEKIAKAMLRVARPLNAERRYYTDDFHHITSASDWATEFTSTRSGLKEVCACLTGSLDKGRIEAFRIFGFLHDFASIGVLGWSAREDDGQGQLSSVDGPIDLSEGCIIPGDQELTRLAADQLDPAGVFSLVPGLWKRGIQ